MTTVSAADVGTAFAERDAIVDVLTTNSDALVAASEAMAERFAAGGMLLVFGLGGAAADAAHAAVEFLHPVIVGKRALPARSLTSDTATLTAGGVDNCLAEQVRLFGSSSDIALVFVGAGSEDLIAPALRTARERGLLTVSLGGPVPADCSVEHALPAADQNPRLTKETLVTMYHVLWELVHVFLERRAIVALPS